MKKLNNKGLTLIELLVSLAILSIFMITVTYFVTTTTKSTKKTKQQITVQQESKEVYETLRDTIMQASCVVINATGLASGNASGSATASGDPDTLVRKTTGFESALSAGTGVQLVSKAAFDTMSYVKEAQAASVGGPSPDDRDKFIDEHDNPTIGNPTKYERDINGKITKEKSRKLSVAQYVGGLSIFDGTATDEFAAFDDREYEISALSTGPVLKSSHMSINDVEKYNTIVFDKTKGKLYLNRPDSVAAKSGFLDFSKEKEYVISDNCIGFTVKAVNDNTLYLKWFL